MMNIAAQVLPALQAKFGEGIIAAQLEAIDPWIEVQAASLPDVCRYLKADSQWHLDFLNCITGVDYLQVDPKKAAKTGWTPHVMVVYHLSSVTKKQALVLKVKLPRWRDDQPGQLPEVPSVSSIWKTALWHEREVYDLSGILFVGHPDLRRILCPEDWVGHPLRKDYEMPTEYHGIRNR